MRRSFLIDEEGWKDSDNLYKCIVCGAPAQHMHHVFMGSKRKLADQDNYIIPLCYRHHLDSKDGIHFNTQLREEWQQIAQEHFERTHTREEFIKRYGRSYL